MWEYPNTIWTSIHRVWVKLSILLTRLRLLVEEFSYLFDYMYGYRRQEQCKYNCMLYLWIELYVM
jgi:hypothetical protein